MVNHEPFLSIETNETTGEKEYEGFWYDLIENTSFKGSFKFRFITRASETAWFQIRINFSRKRRIVWSGMKLFTTSNKKEHQVS